MEQFIILDRYGKLVNKCITITFREMKCIISE